jgi:hypothetical protein
MGDGCGSLDGNELGSQHDDSVGDDESWLDGIHSLDGMGDGCGSLDGNELGSQHDDSVGDDESWLDGIHSLDGLAKHYVAVEYAAALKKAKKLGKNVTRGTRAHLVSKMREMFNLGEDFDVAMSFIQQRIKSLQRLQYTKDQAAKEKEEVLSAFVAKQREFSMKVEDETDERRLNAVLSAFVAKQREFSMKVEDETDERRLNALLKGYNECAALIEDLVLAMEGDNDKSFKSIEKQLSDEYSRLDDINIESIDDYLISLRRRKRDRGRADSEKARMVTQQLLDEKKQFEDLAKVEHKSIQEEFGDYPEFVKKSQNCQLFGL